MKSLFFCSPRIFSCLSSFLFVSLLFVGSAQASGRCDVPVDASLAKFCRADTDKSETLSSSEFLKAFPDMTDQAFLALDSDGNGSLDADEWLRHMGSHGANREPMPKSKLLIAPPKP